MAGHPVSDELIGLDVEILPGQRRLAAAWLGLGVVALALAGIFAILLVVARVPGTEVLFPTQDFFRVALIVHVDQSVLIWFLAFAGVLWAFGRGVSVRWSWSAFGIALTGCLLVASAPFVGAEDPLLSNYVPVLDHPIFLIALAIFGVGALLQVLGYLQRALPDCTWDNPLAIGTLTAAIAIVLVAVSLIWTWFDLPRQWEGKAYYEYLFWGPGHVLQFAYTQVMLVAWLWLAVSVARPLQISPRWLSALLVLGVLPLITMPLIQASYVPDSAESRIAYTQLMQWGNGLAVVPIGFWLILALAKGRGRPLDDALLPQYRALIASVILFVAGGLLGVSIAEVSTVVPAHYHGSIVGVTLALMGLTYHLLPRLGFGIPGGRMARWQPWFYGVGQLLHIGGLAASGAMGIQRKTAGAAQGLDSTMVKAFMGIMGLGGLLAVVGGILFVLVVIKAFLGRATLAASETKPQTNV